MDESRFWRPLAILCRGRLSGNDPNGWRIQFLTIYDGQRYDESNRLKQIFSNSIFDFDPAKGVCRMVSYEDIVSKRTPTKDLRIGRHVGICHIYAAQVWTVGLRYSDEQVLRFSGTPRLLAILFAADDFSDRLRGYADLQIS